MLLLLCCFVLFCAHASTPVSSSPSSVNGFRRHTKYLCDFNSVIIISCAVPSRDVWFFLFFFCVPSYVSGVHHPVWDFLRLWPFLNPTKQVATFRLRESRRDFTGNDHTESRSSRFLQFPYCAENCLQHEHSSGLGCNCVQITCNTSSTYHVQLAVCHVVRRDSSATKFDRLEIAFYFGFILLAEPSTDEGGEETGVPGENPWRRASETVLHVTHVAERVGDGSCHLG